VREGVIHVSNETVLVCYTDGLVEQNNEEGEDFGIEKLQEIILKKQGIEMKKVNTNIILALDKFKKDVTYVDDIALFSCKFL
jgi:sigma-B regulation protein RsbU (phosphoserine phosphatase)